MTSLLFETLRLAELGMALIYAESYYSNLNAFGIRSIESLTQLTMQDYGVIGVSSMDDRKRTY